MDRKEEYSSMIWAVILKQEVEINICLSFHVHKKEMNG